MQQFKPLPIVDSHMHLREPDEALDEIMADYSRRGVERACMLAISNPKDPCVNENAQALWYKSRYPERLHIFVGCDYAFTCDNLDPANQIPLAEQVAHYKQIGIDGWKFLEGKPAFRLRPLNSSFYTGLFEQLAAADLPVLWHVGDPIEFWDKKTLPKWAMPDWSYNESDPTLEELRAEALSVIRQHPSLRVILAHMFFLGYDLDRAQQILDEYPNVYYDLAPGVEMFFGFSKDPERSREFFVKNANRILFSTDRGIANMPAGPRLEMVRSFLETDSRFDPPHSDIVMWPDDRAPIQGIDLPEAALRMIYKENFDRIVGMKPSPLDCDLARKEVCRLAENAGAGSAADIVKNSWKAQAV